MRYNDFNTLRKESNFENELESEWNTVSTPNGICGEWTLRKVCKEVRNVETVMVYLRDYTLFLHCQQLYHTTQANLKRAKVSGFHLLRAAQLDRMV
jgi:hypothetical protein